MRRFLSFFNTIRGRLVILALLVIIPALMWQVYGAWRDLRADVEVRRLESVRAVSHATSDFEALLADARAIFADLVRTNEMRSPANCTQIFTALRFAFERLAPNAVNVGLADAAGNIYCAVNPVQGERNLTGRPEFQAAASSLDMAVGNYAANPQTGAPQVTITYPVLSFDGRVHTVIFATVATSWLENWQRESALPTGSTITLLGGDGQVLWRAVDDARVARQSRRAQADAAAWLAQVRTGGPASEGVDLDGVRRLNTIAPLLLKGQTAGYLHLGYPVAQLYTQAYRNLWWDLAMLGGVLLLALAVAWQGSERLFLHPVRDLMAAVQRLQGGDLGARVSAVRGLGEVAALAQAFDRMADTLQQREIERIQLEQRFRAAFESSAIGMGLLTLDGWIVAANAAVCQMSGYTEEELKQRNDSQNIYPPDAQVGQEMFEEMLAGKRGYYSVEKRYLRKNGEVFWTRLTLSLVCDPRGAPDYLVTLIEDIDEQKRKSAALAESDARFRAMFENAAVGISLIAPDGRVLAVNPVLEQLSGYSEAELIALGGQAITYPADLDVGRHELAEILAGQRNTFQVEKRYVHQDGRIHWMRQSISAVRDAAGKTIYLIVIAEDIDERKRVLEELRASEARFKAMFDNTTVGMALLTPDRRAVQVNEKLSRISGYSIEELLALSPAQLAYPDDRDVGQVEFRELLAGQRRDYTIERRYVRKDGSIFWGRLAYSIVPDDDGRPRFLIGLMEDVTDERAANERLANQEADYRRLLEQRIAERTEELNEANERLREKAAQDAVVAERTRLARDLHDAVTQTLFSTTLIADVLPDLWTLNPAEGVRRLEELRQLTRGALAEMRTLLVELRPNALIEVPLSTLLRQLTEAMISRSRIAIQLSAEGERKLPADVQVGLYRIAQEALNNVVKHARASQAVVTLRLGETTVRLTVADNGAGFDPSTVAADHLGLRIMRERAEAIGARFSIYSEPGEGTQVSAVWERKDSNG